MNKQIKDAILDVVKGAVDARNYGMLSTYRTRFDSHKILRREGIKVGEYKITKGDTVIANIHHRYASRKVNGMYKELNPTIEYLNVA